MARILVIYATKTGQTGKIARFLAEELIAFGHLVNLSPVEELGETKVSDYHGVILGSPIYSSSFLPSIKKWLATNGPNLHQIPTAFFSVSLGIQQVKDLKVIASLKQIESKFFKATRFNPTLRESFAGAMLYSQYGWFKKRMMRRVAKKAGSQDTDFTQDYEYTDWRQVKRFAWNFQYALENKMPPKLSEQDFFLSPP